MTRKRWKYFLAITFAVFVAAVTTALFQAQKADEFILSNGSRVLIRKVSYGRNNVFYHSLVRRMIASESHLSRAWSGIARKLPSLMPMEVNSCWQSLSPVLVIFGEIIVPDDQPRVWEFRAVDANGQETQSLDCAWVDETLHNSKTLPKTFRGIIGAGEHLTNAPSLVRIYELNEKSGSRQKLAELPVRPSK